LAESVGRDVFPVLDGGGRGTCIEFFLFFFSSRRRHTRLVSDWSSDVCSSDLTLRRCARPRPAPAAPDACAYAYPDAWVPCRPPGFCAPAQPARHTRGCAARPAPAATPAPTRAAACTAA